LGDTFGETGVIKIAIAVEALNDAFDAVGFQAALCQALPDLVLAAIAHAEET
jgi:hypothetical protein